LLEEAERRLAETAEMLDSRPEFIESFDLAPMDLGPPAQPVTLGAWGGSEAVGVRQTVCRREGFPSSGFLTGSVFTAASVVVLAKAAKVLRG